MSHPQARKGQKVRENDEQPPERLTTRASQRWPERPDSGGHARHPKQRRTDDPPEVPENPES